MNTEFDQFQPILKWKRNLKRFEENHLVSIGFRYYGVSVFSTWHANTIEPEVWLVSIITTYSQNSHHQNERTETKTDNPSNEHHHTE